MWQISNTPSSLVIIQFQNCQLFSIKMFLTSWFLLQIWKDRNLLMSLSRECHFCMIELPFLIDKPTSVWIGHALILGDGLWKHCLTWLDKGYRHTTELGVDWYEIDFVYITEVQHYICKKHKQCKNKGILLVHQEMCRQI